MKKRILTNTAPQKALAFFEDLTFIPRESGNEQEVSDYLVKFAQDRNLVWSRDEALNVVIRKAASAGYEGKPGLIFQAHMDMVCEKTPGTDINFAVDPISFEIDGDKIISRNTTLGADNGIGAAFILAVLDDDSLAHPEIEAVFTADEERGLLGINRFDFSQLKGHYLINLDSADEGVVVCGCAGGPMVRTEFPVTVKCADPDKIYFAVHVNDLLGGHSGEDIHRGRGNANKLMAGLLAELRRELAADIADFRGGRKANAIPRDAKAIIGIHESQIDDMDRTVGKYAIEVAEEYEETDPDISIYCAGAPVPETVLTEESADAVISFVNETPNGVIRMDDNYPGVVETSICLGIVRLRENILQSWSMIRSSNVAEGRNVLSRISEIAVKYNGQMEKGAAFPAWQPDPESELRDKYLATYKALYGKEASCTVLHAGLEPGVFAGKMGRRLDMISLGPDVRNLHAPGEYVTISSCVRLWDTIKALIAAL